MVSESPKLAIDMMGADMGTEEVMAGVKLALDSGANLPDLTLIGDEAIIQKALEAEELQDHPKLSIFHASEVISMDDKPVQALKQKKDSSMVRGLDLIKEGGVAGLISCGNTGALMAGATIKLRTMRGIERPALSSVIPSKDHHFILLDAGANPTPTAKQLVHNAILGSNHCKVELGIYKPKVGLLSIGTEESKGTELTHETHNLLKSIDGLINYTGLIEGFHVFEQDIDVVVCDGFVGNILIKTCESMFLMLKDVIKDELTAKPWRKVGAALSMGAFREMKRKFDPDKHGAAPLLGVNGTVLKAHGSSNRTAIGNAILHGAMMVTQNMNERILEEVEEANKLMKAAEEEVASAE